MSKTVICLIGPTAVGKTAAAVKLAEKINAEIISCDSMQVYKGASIAGSQPSAAEQKAVPHHLLGAVSLSSEYNAARFCASAEKLIRSIHRKGKIPLIAGGTGLYLRALLDGLFPCPAENKTLRRKFKTQAAKYGCNYLFRRLQKIDKQAAEHIHPNDLRRIIRALEVYQLTGTPISRLQEKASGIRQKYRFYIFGLNMPRQRLYGRIEARVERMFRRGLVKEIKRISGMRLSKTAKSLLGYKEVKGFLDGEYSLDEAKARLKKNTRRYAKRQISWFKREKGVYWLDVGAQETAESAAGRIALCLKPEEIGKRRRSW